MVSPPSTITFGLVAPTTSVKVMGIVSGPAPQLKVTVPAAASCVDSAASVQEPGVPLPTTPASAVAETRAAQMVAVSRAIVLLPHFFLRWTESRRKLSLERRRDRDGAHGHGRCS